MHSFLHVGLDDVVQRKRNEGECKAESQHKCDQTLPSRFFEVNVECIETAESSQDGHGSEEEGVPPEEVSNVDELEGGHERGNHSNILVGTSHNLWNHVVRQEKWTEDHTTGNTSETAKSGSNSTKNG